MAKTPKIRFKNFSDEWVENKLGNISDITTGKLNANAMKEDGKYDFYTSGIQKYKIDIPAFEGPAITIAGNGATVGYMYLADEKFNAYQRTYVLLNFKENRIFLFFEIKNKLSKKIAQEARAGNIPYIVLDMLTNLEIFTPIAKEQQKIGAFFSKLDKLIALHQSKFEKLQKIKKSCLQNLFPQNNQNTPKIRFKNFSDEWVENKLGDTIISIPFKAYLANAEKIGNYPVIQQGDIPIAGYSNQEPFLDFCNVVLFGDHTLSLYNPKSPFLLASDGIKILSAKNLYDDFLFQLLKKYMPKSEGYKRHFSILKNICFYYPNSEEQEKIGAFFSKLDKLIALHQSKFEKLQKIKKSCLQNMFV